MRNKWLWLLGGGGLVWLLWPKSESKPTKPGDLAISVIGFKGGQETAVQEAVQSANAVCAGLPAFQGLSRPPTVSGGPDSRSMQIVVSALWTHDNLGPLKEEVRACFERAIATVAPGVKVSATRVS